MEAQAAAHKLAAQHVAQAALRGLSETTTAPNGETVTAVRPESPPQPDEPTDLTMDAEKIRERLEREQRYLSDHHRSRMGPGAVADSPREREELEPRPKFDFRHLIPQVSLKTENF